MKAKRTTPYSCRSRSNNKVKVPPLSPLLSAKVKEKLEDLGRRGIIKKSSSSWASPILIVSKKDNDFRLLADYKRLNKEVTGNA